MKDDYDNWRNINKDMTYMSQLINQYYNLSPSPSDYKEHCVNFGTSGHRGTSAQYSFNEAHVLAITQSIVQMRIVCGINGPCYVGKDTHILSEPAFISVLEVLAANCINVIIQENNEYTPTPVISHAIVSYNKIQNSCSYSRKADGIVITASHNPPEDGGIKYTSIFGGPASIQMTKFIEQSANRLLINNLYKVNRIALNGALKSGYIHFKNFIYDYVKNLNKIVNMQAIRASGLKIGVDPLGGTSIMYWQNIAQYYQLDLIVTNDKIDKTFSFMDVDYDGRIRLDCSSELTLTRALKLSRNFDLFFVNDPDCDRHGIITSLGLMASNDYFSVAIDYLFQNRPLWNRRFLSVGKTDVSSTKIDHVVDNLCNKLIEVPVGFKWFSKSLFNGSLGFAGEDSAGAAFLDYNGLPWSTDKDGLIMSLLAAEIVAVTDQTIQKNCTRLLDHCNVAHYSCTKIFINRIQRNFLLNTMFDSVGMTELAEDSIIAVKNIIPTNQKKTMDGIKIFTVNGWVACRLSGTESIYKIYCESFLDYDHCKKMEKEIIENIYKIFNQFY